ncbi:MAG TPA: sigma-70 family RNA polymerase sigma factor [Chthonomonas sp.]|uniref:sigma-70 family RNA polymerase sigma factor n=1 Tax=Chthonomonas sp. TaxID=2282153 RepID=UPI002B4B5ED7|nr:sigma-70 family RNA polymerase sigma factor [Chthonomonas sp.]HLH79570.1 sigma-70 family RNA polymerase sigma factor [Chthonomonas sp.]
MTPKENDRANKTYLWRDNPMRRYSEEEILELLETYRQQQDLRLRDRIVLNYTNLVESIARRFSGASEPTEDLAQEGYIGLITAIELYDPKKNVKFSTYATHFIIGQIKHYLRDRGKIIKEPAWLQELNLRLNRISEALTQQLGRTPTYGEIAEKMGMREEEVAELMTTREVFRVTSIDGFRENEDGSPHGYGERQDIVDQAVAFQLPIEDRIMLETAMKKLKALEQQVLVEFYFKDLNQTEIAQKLGISCNYVSHLIRNSTRKLRKILTTEDPRTTQLQLAQLRQEFDMALCEDPSLIVDPLTKLYNRRYFDMRLQEELNRARRINSEVAVILLRMEGLEAFTHYHGTLWGDEAVQLSAQRLRQTVRRSDIVTRYASDTFAVILPYTGSTANAVLQRIRATFEDWLKERGWNRSHAPLCFTYSVAWFPMEANHPETLLRLLEERLSPVRSLRKAA